MDGFSVFGLLGFIFGLAALAKANKLEKRLNELRVPDQDSKPD